MDPILNEVLTNASSLVILGLGLWFAYRLVDRLVSVLDEHLTTYEKLADRYLALKRKELGLPPLE